MHPLRRGHSLRPYNVASERFASLSFSPQETKSPDREEAQDGSIAELKIPRRDGRDGKERQRRKSRGPPIGMLGRCLRVPRCRWLLVQRGTERGRRQKRDQILRRRGGMCDALLVFSPPLTSTTWNAVVAYDGSQLGLPCAHTNERAEIVHSVYICVLVILGELTSRVHAHSR